MLTARLPTSPDAPFKDVQNGKEQRIGARWKSVIKKCIAPDPAERFHDVGNVWQSLSRGSSARYLDSNPLVTTVKGYAIVFKGVVLLVVALLGLIWAGILPNPFRRLPEQKHIAVLPFQTIGNDAVDQAFSAGVVESLTSKLS